METGLLNQEVSDYGVSNKWTGIGHVISMGDGVARIIGLTEIQAGEFVTFITKKKKFEEEKSEEIIVDVISDEESSDEDKRDEVTGIALNLENNTISVAIFGNERLVGQGTEVHRGLRLLVFLEEKFY